jgi:hypothetical protein
MGRPFRLLKRGSRLYESKQKVFETELQRRYLGYTNGLLTETNRPTLHRKLIDTLLNASIMRIALCGESAQFLVLTASRAYFHSYALRG